ncbi:MAG: TlpA family protein disulfide reductase [Solirubrobacteraceae bacterium]
MRRFMVPGLATFVAIALIAVLAYGINTQGENTSIDSQVAHGHDPLAPSANDALDLLGGGGKASLASYRGKVVVMNIFASWCTTCVGELPLLENTQRRLDGHGGIVLGVTYQDNSYDAGQFVAAHHLTYPVIQDINGNLVRSFGTDAVPETFVIDGTGHVTAILRGPVSGRWLSRSVRQAMAAPRA